MNFPSLYQTLFDAMTIGGPQAILNAAYQCIGLPLIVVNTSYQVLAVANEQVVNDDIFNTLVTTKQASSELVWLFHDNKYIDAVCSNQHPVYLNWGSLTIPQISGAIRVNGIIEGYIGVVCPSDVFTSDLIQATEIILHALALDWVHYKNKNTHNHPLLETFTRTLIKGNFKQIQDLQKWEQHLGATFDGPYMLVGISLPSSRSSGLLHYFTNTFSVAYGKILTTLLSDTLYLLFYHLEQTTSSEKLKEHIQQALHPFGAYHSVSPPFSDLMEVSTYRFEIEKALEFGPLLKSDELTFHYKDYASYVILSYPIKEMPKACYTHPIIKILIDFDEKNHTNYLNTLEVSILNFLNSQKVAKVLHIHRNTLLYRLNKIEEITHCSLQDEKLLADLLISFKMLQTNKRLKK